MTSHEMIKALTDVGVVLFALFGAKEMIAWRSANNSRIPRAVVVVRR